MKCPNCGYVHNKENAEEVKQKKDRKRAEAAIAALERVIADPSSNVEERNRLVSTPEQCGFAGERVQGGTRTFECEVG